MRVRSAASLSSCLRRTQPIEQPGEGREHRDDRPTDEGVRAGMPEVVAPRVLVAADDRDDIEHRAQQVRPDGDVGERRVEWFAGEATQTVELSTLQGDRWPY